MKRAFTLAEVLITLGIIGVVAAITIPGIVQKYQKKLIANRVKHGVNILQQAILRSSVDNGTPDSWGLTDGQSDTFDIYIKPYLKIINECIGSVDNIDSICNSTAYTYGSSSKNSYSRKYFLQNGTSIMFRQGGTGFTSQRRGKFIIIPKTKKEKLILGKNAFSFNLIIQDNVKYQVTSAKDYDDYSKNFSRAKLIEFCEQGSGGHGFTEGIACSYLLESNGWEFPEDYPIKF